MHIHIIGICGTFMGGLALLARELGYSVSGSDQGMYPPMSSQLARSGIKLFDGYSAGNLDDQPDLIVIGNAMSRGNQEVEAVLNQGLPYTSGPQWLLEHVLQGRHVLAVAGTHGKTTTSSMLAWILEYAELAPGFLIGGIAQDFGVSARLGKQPYFVVEADEYDSAFFDKRSKFVHYRPRTAILNNLEFDHADIFDDLPAIQRQFHHLVRTIPGDGLIIAPENDDGIRQTLDMGCWTPVESTSVDGLNQRSESTVADWSAVETSATHFAVLHNGVRQGEVQWAHSGLHNRQNGLAAIAAAKHVGVTPQRAISALNHFKGVKRRLEVIGEYQGVTLYDDFAHHPTAISLTLEGLRTTVGNTQRIIAIIEPRSNTMRMGVHAATLADSVAVADSAFIYKPEGLSWELDLLCEGHPSIHVFSSIESIIDALLAFAQPDDHWVFMSNGGFGGIYEKVLSRLRN
ncbi:MAG TPA: UDP-N-acetylmuramate:L-alanyl-gamma-D-glutamyl-meso-diaminopimelate ligase [Crenotrichaceae bacterium]|nr:UDP-N-acetylmuramate:L-alanyl-gamma-D-glutamyl-meso-diaminopimelate ligase [Crenotrichaceae bacterium]